MKLRSRLRQAAFVILLLGFGLAALVYCAGTTPEDYSDNPDTARAYKNDKRQVEINFGQTGGLLIDLMDELKHPAVQAGIIVVCTGLAAGGCLYFSGMPGLEKAEDTAGQPQ